jgi:hypothetical protein
MILANAPTTEVMGVPESRPVAELKLDQPGWFWME